MEGRQKGVGSLDFRDFSTSPEFHIYGQRTEKKTIINPTTTIEM